MHENFATLWEAVADALPERVAVVQGERRETYAEFDDRAARLAAALGELGAGPDSKVVLFLRNCPEYLEAVHAAFKLRAVPINANFRYLEDELVALVEDSGAELLLFHGDLGERVEAVQRRAAGLRSVIQVDDGSPPLPGALAYEELLRSHKPAPRCERSGDDHFMIYTGGTTGHPKGVIWTHENLFGTLTAVYTLAGLPAPVTVTDLAERAAEMTAAGRAPVVLPAPPLIHGTAFFLSQTALLVGGTVVFLTGASFDPHEVWQAVGRERVSQLVIVGDAFAGPLVRALEEAEAAGRPYDLSALTQIVSAGVMWSAPIKAALIERAPVMLFDLLGATEGGPFGISVSGPGMLPDTARFRLGERAKVLREDGTEIQPGSGEVGVLAVAEPIPDGYHGDPERTARVFRTVGGRRYSIPGDYATLEADGTLVLLGRGSVCINTGGEKVYPEEVEECVKTHPAVADCTVVGVPDARWGEAVVAVVAWRPGAEPDAAAVKAAVKQRVAGHKVPKHVVAVDAIQRSAAGKADYRWARETAIERLSPERETSGAG